MKLTIRQLKSVVDILMKEEQEKVSLEKASTKAKKNSAVNESLLFEASPGLSDIAAEFSNDMDDFSLDYSQDVIPRLDKEIYKSLAELIKRRTKVNMSWMSLQEEMEPFGTYELQMELATDIKTAIDKYIASLGKAAVEMLGPEEDEATQDVEPKYSEYE
jgi:hypothetical protein